nr:MAG TPA: hypothetical protein [Caudoviricetes sp.]
MPRLRQLRPWPLSGLPCASRRTMRDAAKAVRHREPADGDHVPMAVRPGLRPFVKTVVSASFQRFRGVTPPQVDHVGGWSGRCYCVSRPNCVLVSRFWRISNA